MISTSAAQLRPLAAIVLVCGCAAGFQSASDSGRGANGALYIQGVVFFRAGHVPVGVGDYVGLGG
jgi:hypothetical protein